MIIVSMMFHRQRKSRVTRQRAAAKFDFKVAINMCTCTFISRNMLCFPIKNPTSYGEQD